MFKKKELSRRISKELFALEALEARLLLSGDPILGAAQAALLKDQLDPDEIRLEAPAAGPQHQENGDQAQMPPVQAAGYTFDLSQALPGALSGEPQLVISPERLDQHILIGGNRDASPDAYHLDPGQLSSWLGGGGLVQIGSPSGSHVIEIGDASTPGGEVRIDGHLLLVNPMAGGEILVQDRLVGAGITVYGSGHTLHLEDDMSMDDDIKLLDSVKVFGDRRLDAGTDGTGAIQIGGSSSHTLEGGSLLDDDRLTLSAPGNVVIKTVIGDTKPLSGLTIEQAASVSFEGRVKLNGDLYIQASGTVTFEDSVIIEGGSLTILGANSVVFKKNLTVTGGGDILIEADEIDFNNGAESVSGSGTITLRTATLGNMVELGAPPGQLSSSLNLNVADLQALADGFSAIIIGHVDGGHAKAGAGTVRIGSIGAFEDTFKDSVSIYGGSIEVADLADSNLIFTTRDNLTLDAYGDILLKNQVQTSSDIVLYSATGRVAQENSLEDGKTLEVLKGDDIQVMAATGIQLGWVNAGSIDALNTGTGDLVINQVAAGGNLNVLRASQSSAAATGGIQISTEAGDILLAAAGQGVTHLGTGEVLLDASANIQQSADVSAEGGQVKFLAGGYIKMSDGTTTRSESGTGTGSVVYEAATDIELSIVDADGSIELTATEGAITEVLTGEAANLRGGTSALTMTARNGIGTASEDINTQVASISLSNSTLGGAYILEEDGLTVTSAGISLAGAEGNLSLRTLDGALTIEGQIETTGAVGNVLLQTSETAEATLADLSIQATLSSANGHISLLSADDVIQSAAGHLSLSGAGKTLDVQADGAIDMADGALSQTQNGNVRYRAEGGSLNLSAIHAGTGSVSLWAAQDILDAGDSHVDLVAASLRLNAGWGAGAATDRLETTVNLLSARVGSQGLFIQETDALTVGEVAAIEVARVQANGGTSLVTDAAQASLIGTGAGALVLRAGGTLQLGDGADQEISSAGGNILLESLGGDLTIQVQVDAGTGSMTLKATGAVSQSGEGSLTVSGAGTIDLAAGTTLTMNDQTKTSTAGGNIRYSAGGDLSLTALDAGTGAVSLVSGGAILGQAGNGTHVAASGLRIEAAGGVGQGNAPLQLAVERLSVHAGGGLFLAEEDDLTIGEPAAIEVNRVDAAGATTPVADDPVQRGILVTNDGAVVVTAQGNLTLGEGDPAMLILQAQGSGNVRLSAQDLDVREQLDAGTGHINLIVQGDLDQSADIQTQGGTIYASAGGDIAMGNAIRAGSAGGHILYAAGGDLTLGLIDAGSGQVALQAGTGSILDGDNLVDVIAAGLTMTAGNGVGTSLDAIETQAGFLSGSAGAGGWFVAESDEITIGQVVTQVQRLNTDASIQSVEEVDKRGISVANGALVLSAGAISVSEALSASGAGAVLLSALDGDLNVQAQVDSGTGALSLLADGAIQQSAEGDLTTDGASLDLEAGSHIQMADGATSATAGGNIRYKAGGDITLGGLDAGAGAISLISGGTLLDGGDTDTDLAAGLLRIEAHGAGSGGNALETQIATLSARLGAGGLFLHEANDIVLGAVAAISVQRVLTDGSLNALSDAALDDVLVTGDGSLILRADGGIRVTDGANGDSLGIGLQGNGNLLLWAANGDLELEAAIQGGQGSLSLVASGAFSQSAAASLSTGGSGTIDVAAGTALTMADGALAQTAGGDIRYEAGGDLTLGALDAGTGRVALLAGGAILDGDAAVDVTASGLILSAAGAVGGAADAIEVQAGTISGGAGTGGWFLSATGAVTVDQVIVSVNRVGTDGGSEALDSDRSDIEVSDGGALILTATAIQVKDGDGDGKGLTAAGGGPLLLQATAGDLTLEAGVDSGTGALSLLASGAVRQLAAGDLSAASTGTIDVQAGGAIEMSDGAVTATAGGHIRYQAGGDITLGSLQAGAGSISLISTGNILDGGDSHVDLKGGGLRIQAQGAGSGTNALETEVATISARIGAGGLFLDEADAVQVGGVAAISVDRVAGDGSTSAQTDTALSDLILTGDGALVLRAGGDLQVTDGANADDLGISLQGSGNLLLQSVNGAIEVQAAIQAGQGHLSLLAGGGISQAATGGLSTGGTGTLDVQAGGAIVMSDGAASRTGGGNIRYQAGGDITLGGLDAGSGSISLVSDGVILDGGDSHLDLVAHGLRVEAQGFGTGAQHIETQVTVLSAALGSGGLFLNEADAIQVGQVAAISVNRVGADAATNTQTDQARSDLTTSGNGAIVLSATEISLEDGGDADGISVQAAGSGNVLLQARTGGLTLNAAVGSGSGHLSLLAAGAIQQSAEGDLNTGGGSLDVEAGTSISMADGATSTTGGGNLRYAAGGDITLGGLDAGAGSISLVSGGSILDGGDSHTDLVAASLRIQAQGAGAGNEHLETRVGTLSAKLAGGGLFLYETDATQVGEVAALSVGRVAGDGSTSALTDAAQSDLQADADGSIVLSASAITLNDGGDSDGLALRASGAGNVLLQARGGDLELNADLNAGSGHLSLLASGAIRQGAAADILTAGGTLDLSAGTGISMTDGATLQSQGGHIRLQAAGNITLGLLDARAGLDRAGWGRISLTSTAGSILDAGESAEVNLYGRDLMIRAQAGGIGQLGAGADALEMDVATLALTAGSGGANLNNRSTLTIGEVEAFEVQRVTADGSVTAQGDAALRDAQVSSNGGLVLNAAGNLRIEDGGDGNNRGIYLQGTGNLRLNSETGSISLEASIQAGQGSISLVAQTDVTQAANVRIQTGASGTLDVVATTGSITMQDTSYVLTANGDIHYRAGGDVTLASLMTGGNGTASVWVEAGGSVLDGGDSQVDIIANGVAILAGGGIGTAGNAIDTKANVLAARAADGIFLSEEDGAEVGQVNLSYRRVDLGAQTSQLSEGLADLTATGAGAIVLRANSLRITDGGDGDGLGVEANGGVVLLETRSTDLNLESGLSSAGGSVSLQARRAVLQSADGRISIQGAGTLDVAAGTSVTMSDGASSSTEGGNIRYKATNDITLGGLDAGAGAISLIAGGVILDGGDADRDLAAASIRIEALGAGSAANALEISANVLAAQAGAQGLFLNELDGLTIGTVAAVSVQRIAADTTATAVEDAALSDVKLDNGGALSLTLGGTLWVTDGANANGLGIQGAGSVQLSAVDMDIQAVIQGVNLDLTATGTVQQSAAGDLAASGTIDLKAGTISMADGASGKTQGGDIRYEATGNITLGGLDAGTGTIHLISGGSILDGGDSDRDLVAANLSIQALGAGTVADALETSVSSLSAQVGEQGLFLDELDDIVLSGVTAGILVVNAGGTLQVTADGNGLGVEVTGAARLSAAAQVIQAQIRGGNLTLLATGSIQQMAGGNLAASGSIDLEAAGIAMADGATSTTQGGTIRYQAMGDITLGGLDAGSGAISLVSGGRILDGGDSDRDLAAASLRIEAQGVGTASNALETAVGTLAAQVGAEGLFLDELDALILGAVAAISVQRVGSDAATTALVDEALSDVTLTGGGILVLNALGALTVSDGADGDGLGIETTGSVRLSAGAMEIQSGVQGQNLSLLASGAIQQTAAGDLAATGTIDLEAASISMADGATSTTQGGNIRYQAVGDISLGGLDVGSGAISLIAGGSILDGGDTDLDLVAGGLQIQAAAVGNAGNGLETAVETLAASLGGGGLFLSDVDDLRVAGGLGIAVRRVAADASVSTLSDPLLTDIRATGGASIHLKAGGDLWLSAMTSLGGRVILDASGSILASTAGVHVTAASLSLNAGQGVGSATLAIGTQVARLDGATGGNWFLSNSGALELGPMRLQEGVLALSASSILVTADLQVQGNLRLTSQEGDLGIEAELASVDGSLSLHAAGNITLGAAGRLTASGAGTLDLVSGRNLVMADGATAVTAGGNIRFEAAGDITLTGLNASTGSISLVSGGLILDGGDRNLDLAGQAVRIQAMGAGSPRNPLETAIGVLAAQVGQGGLHLSERDQLSIGDVAAIGLLRIGDDGSAQQLADQAMSGLAGTQGALLTLQAQGDLSLGRISTDGNAVLQAGGSVLAGDAAVNVSASSLTLRAGLAVGSADRAVATEVARIDGGAAGGGWFVREADDVVVGDLDITAGGTLVLTAGTLRTEGDIQGSGNLLLRTERGDLTIASGIRGSDGHLNLVSAAHLRLLGQVAASGAGSVELAAEGDVGMDEGARIETASGDIRLLSGGELRLGELVSASGRVALEGVRITAGVAEVHVRAAGLSLITAGAVGGIDAPVRTAVATLAGAYGGDWFLAEADDLEIGGVAVTTYSVGSDGLETARASSLTDLQGQGGIAWLRAGGDLKLSGKVDAGQGGILALESGGTLLDGDADIDIRAAALYLAGAVGQADDPLEVQADVLAGAGGGQGWHVRVAGDVILGEVRLSPDIVFRGWSGQGGSLQLDLSGNLTQAADIDSLGGQIRIRAEGTLTMAAEASAWSRGGQILYQAGGDLLLSRLDARGEARTGDVTLRTGASGQILDANLDVETNIYAAQFNMLGRGPMGEGPRPTEEALTALRAAAIEVEAERVYAISPDNLPGWMLYMPGEQSHVVLQQEERWFMPFLANGPVTPANSPVSGEGPELGSEQPVLTWAPALRIHSELLERIRNWGGAASGNGQGTVGLAAALDAAGPEAEEMFMGAFAETAKAAIFTIGEGIPLLPLVLWVRVPEEGLFDSASYGFSGQGLSSQGMNAAASDGIDEWLYEYWVEDVVL